MIEEGDPLAVALLAQYKNLPMPNFGFGDVEVDALIAYMEEMDKKREAGAREGKAAN